MSEAGSRDKILSLSQVQAQQERVVHELIQYMVNLRLDEFEATLDSYIKAKGIEKTIIQITYSHT